MKVQRYVAMTFGAAIALTLLGLVVVIVSAQAIETGLRFEVSESPALTALRLAGCRAVVFGFQMVPGACFLGALVAGTALARRGELLAIQAAGIPTRKIWYAYSAVALLACVLGWALGEWAVPDAVSALERIGREEVGRTDKVTQFFQRRPTWFHEGNLILYLPDVDTGTQIFSDPVIYRREEGLIAELIQGETLRYDRDQWVVSEARELTLDPPRDRRLEERAIPLGVDPRDLTDVAGDPRQMQWNAIRKMIKRRVGAHLDVTAHELELHNRLAFPLGCLVVVWLVAPWALHPERRRSLAVALGAGSAVIGVLFALTYTLRLLALGSKLPPALGAWGFVLVCGLSIGPSHFLYSRYAAKRWTF